MYKLDSEVVIINRMSKQYYENQKTKNYLKKKKGTIMYFTYVRFKNYIYHG